MAVPLFVLDKSRKNFGKRRKVLEDFSESEIKIHTGLPWWAVSEFIELFQPLEGKRRSSIPLETKVLCFLNYLRSGSFQYVLANAYGTTQPKVSEIISECTDQVIQLAPEYVYFIKNSENLLERKQKFYDIASFPNVIGVIDGSHIPITAPHQDAHLFVNRKRYYSINCQVVCDSNYSFLDVVANWPGSSHDSFIWKHSSLRGQICGGEFGDGWLLGDSGYPLEPWLLTPYLNPTEEHKKNYNKSFIKTRTTVERAIGLWKSRFRSMCRTGGFSCYREDKVCKLIVASAILHNICIRKSVPLLPGDEDYIEELILEGNHQPTESYSSSATNIRNRIASEYFH